MQLLKKHQIPTRLNFSVIPNLQGDCPPIFTAPVHPEATSYCVGYTVTPQHFLHGDGEKSDRKKKNNQAELISSGPVIQLNEKGNVPLPVMPPFLMRRRAARPSSFTKKTHKSLASRDGGRASHFLSGSPLYFLHIFTNNHRLGEIA